MREKKKRKKIKRAKRIWYFAMIRQWLRDAVFFFLFCFILFYFFLSFFFFFFFLFCFRSRVSRRRERKRKRKNFHFLFIIYYLFLFVVKLTPREIAHHVKMNARTACTLPKNRNSVWIATECGNVFVNPSQYLNLILQTLISRRYQVLGTQKSQWSKPDANGKVEKKKKRKNGKEKRIIIIIKNQSVS